MISQSIHKNKAIDEHDVRVMLGLADKTKIISLLNEIFSGDENEALKYLKSLIEDGLDAKNFLNDVLEVLYLFSRRINLGKITKDMSVSEAEVKLVDQFSKNIDIQDITLFWQLTIETIDDLRIVGNENLALEMYIMQLAHLKNLGQEKSNNNESNINLIGKDNLIEKKQKAKMKTQPYLIK